MILFLIENRIIFYYFFGVFHCIVTEFITQQSIIIEFWSKFFIFLIKFCIKNVPSIEIRIPIKAYKRLLTCVLLLMRHCFLSKKNFSC